MNYSVIKLIITLISILLITELAKRNTTAGALLASIPLISVMAMIWLYIDTHDIAKVTRLSTSIFWLVIPSLVLFLAFPALIKLDIPFYAAMGISIILTIFSYFIMIRTLSWFGISL